MGSDKNHAGAFAVALMLTVFSVVIVLSTGAISFGAGSGNNTDGTEIEGIEFYKAEATNVIYEDRNIRVEYLGYDTYRFYALDEFKWGWWEFESGDHSKHGDVITNIFEPNRMYVFFYLEAMYLLCTMDQNVVVLYHI